MKLSVVIPTYRRAESLSRCLEGLRAQQRPPDEVLIITQTGDEESASMLAGWNTWSHLRIIQRAARGQVAQLNIGLDEATGDVIAFTDDDAVPRPDWLDRIEKHFITQDDLGGVGGRDYVVENGAALTGSASLIGTVQWFGRVVGNHHVGGRRDDTVDCLKGANMAYRQAAINGLRFDTDLRGDGAQTCNDWAFSLSLKKIGWRLLYDPQVAVDHFPAKRHDDDQRGAPSMKALEDSSFNFYLSLRRHMKGGVRRQMALMWALLVGIENSPGIVRGWLQHLRGDPNIGMKRQTARSAWQATKQLCSRK